MKSSQASPPLQTQPLIDESAIQIQPSIKSQTQSSYPSPMVKTNQLRNSD